jgi:hypothetical protein
MSVREQCTYHSFLLRLWKESSHPQWRASLQSTATGEQFGFACLAELHEFLLQQTGNLTPATSSPTNDSGLNQVQGAPT